MANKNCSYEYHDSTGNWTTPVPAVVIMSYQFDGFKRKTHYVLCAEHAAQFNTDPKTYIGSKPLN